MTDFHKTSIGQMFYGKHVPELIKELRRMADALEKGNKFYMQNMKTEKKKPLKEKIKEVEETDAMEEKLNINQGGMKSDPDLQAIDE